MKLRIFGLVISIQSASACQNELDNRILQAIENQGNDIMANIAQVKAVTSQLLADIAATRLAMIAVLTETRTALEAAIAKINSEDEEDALDEKELTDVLGMLGQAEDLTKSFPTGSTAAAVVNAHSDAQGDTTAPVVVQAPPTSAVPTETPVVETSAPAEAPAASTATDESSAPVVDGSTPAEPPASTGDGTTQSTPAP